MRDNDPSSSRLRLKITYEQNEVLKWDAEVELLTGEIKNDAGILQQVRYFIDQLRTPFGFLQRDIPGLMGGPSQVETEELADHPYIDKEKMAAEKHAPHTCATMARTHSTSVCAVRPDAYPKLDIVATPQ